MRKQIVEHSTEYVQYVNPDGSAHDDAPDYEEDFLKEVYHMMKLTRAFDHKLFKLQRSGKIGTYAEVRGEEGSEVGSAFALQDQDWFVPSFRETGVYLVRGADRAKMVQAWNGDVRAFQTEKPTRNLPVSIPIASQLLHAVGIAWAMKLKQENSAVIVYFGDGATSEGDFHEAMNFAGVYNLPIVFWNQNNQWAISTPREKQTKSETLAQKAHAYGFEGIQIDGNDVLATYTTAKEALEKARNGGGPTLVESVTYRVGDHTTSDDSLKYRTEEEIHGWEEKDPVARLEKYLANRGFFDDDYKAWVEKETKEEVDKAVKAGLNTEPSEPADLFKHVFVNPPPEYEDQLNALKQELGGDQ